jgi:hypothetical protein
MIHGLEACHIETIPHKANALRRPACQHLEFSTLADGLTPAHILLQTFRHLFYAMLGSVSRVESIGP